MSGEYSSSFAQFFLRCKHGFIEHATERKLDLEEKKLEQTSNAIDLIQDSLNITFSTVPHRTDEEIQTLLNDKE
jgi:hypothetical protein